MVTMECASEPNAYVSPVGRARCNTWHAGLNDTPQSQCCPPSSDSSSLATSSHGVKRPSSRRNAWGPASYADLIAAAIDGAPDRRLTLSQIYDWMVTNVPYFGDKADNANSAGWKNSIRHNLSLHRRFVRLPHADGKSSWWTLNQAEMASSRWSRAPASRRRADSMDIRTLTSQQRPRRGRKPAANEGVLGERERRISGKGSLVGNLSETAYCNPIEESANNSVDREVHNSSNPPSDADDQYAAVSPTSVNNFGLCSGFEANMFLFNPATVTALSIGTSNTATFTTDDLLSIGTSNTATFTTDDLSPFGLQRLSTVDCPLYFENDHNACDDGESNARMIMQVPSWDSPVLGNDTSVDTLSLDDDNYATSEGDKLSDLFSDIAMSYDETSVSHLDSSLDECFHDSRSSLSLPISVTDSNELLIASAHSTSQQSVEFNLRRGSDAPPPSPEFDCSVPLSIGDDEKPNVRLWSSVLNCKFSELSNSSDMDTDH